MNVLHYSFSLSACPKCHLLICQHTSLANLEFDSLPQPITECSNPTISTQHDLENPYQQLSSHGTNFYIFPSTISDTRHSWTTFGTQSIESIHTLNNLSFNNETISDAIPFANENIIQSSLSLNQIVRTQSEKFKSSIDLAKSLSYSTSFSHIKHEDNSIKKSSRYLNRSFFLILILIFSYLITNTIDIVLIYIYYHTNYLYLISFISTIILCDMILWMNNLIQLKTLPSYLLLIPFIIRLYLLYELVELLTMAFDNNDNIEIFDSSSSTSSSTATTITVETTISQTTNSPINNRQLSTYTIRKQRLFYYLTLFYLVHTGFFTFINFYFWSNNFEPSTKSVLNMDYFIPQWTLNDDLLSTTTDTITTYASTMYLEMNPEHSARRTMFTNWTQYLFSSYIPLSIRLPSSSLFVLISISYYLIINYSFISTFLIFKRFSLFIIPSILSHLCLILTRIYTFIFLFRFNIWWLPISFLLIHIILLIILLFDQFKYQHKRNTIFLQIIFSLLTQNSIDNISIHALISIENISIFIYRLYLEIISFDYNDTVLRLIIFLTILISIQIIGFIFDILSKNILYRTKSIIKL
ncbi:unnamed protein product [Adineta steineri]|uniref:Uncharacterized protein n=1 Tax=Adineta steineri TaxID=433720 RepID=A0A813P4R3_9BILA|nr:unnamed protein product [Adineta steineri]CAF0862442.1 unnamed protein product [Adineta steineri]